MAIVNPAPNGSLGMFPGQRIFRESMTAAISANRKGLAAGKFEGWSGAQSGWFIFTPYAVSAFDKD